MSPLLIELLLHYYCSHAPFPKPSPAATEGLKTLIDKEAVTINHYGTIELTERGQAYVAKLLSLPLPTKQVTWIFT